jgi:hypothetical protein
MTRGRVLRVDAELHDGQRLQVFNVHQATSGDMQLQQHTWQILTKSIVECRHQRILRIQNANASGLRVGYAASNAEHMKRVDELLTQFVTDTQGELMSPSTVSWRQGSKGAKLDHIVTWNLSHDSSTGSLGACWRSVGTEIPEGCKELDHPALAQWLARTTILTQHEFLLLLPQGLNAQSVVRVGEQVFRPVPLGQLDWLGGPQYDHARVGFRIAPQVLAHTRKYCSQAEGTTRIRLKDWQKLAPAMQRELGDAAAVALAGVRAGTVEASAAVQDTLRSRNQLARSWMTPTIWSRERHQRRAAHRSHEQIQLLRTIARVEAALQDGPQAMRVTRAQNLVLEDMDVAWSSPLSPQEKLSITSTESWRKYLVASLKSCKEVERQTISQVRENRRSTDRRARKAFEDEHKGPSNFAGKRAEHRTQEELRWRVPHGIQWVEWQKNARDEVWAERMALQRQECPGIQVHQITGNMSVGVMQVGKQAEEEVQRRITDAGERWRHQVAVQHKLELARVIGDLTARWKIIPGDDTRLGEVMDTAMQELLRRPGSVQEQARIGSKGLSGSQEHRWVTIGPEARMEMENWLHQLDADTPSISPFQLKWDQQQLVLSHSGLKWAADQGQTRIEPTALATSMQRDGKLVRIVTLTVPTLSLVDALLTESQKWDSDTLINRQILMDEGPWRGTDMTVAWELYFQAQGLAPGARCERTGCSPKQPHVILAKADGDGKQRHPRRQLTGFCDDDCWQHAHLRHGRDEVPDMSFLFNAGVFKGGKRIDPRARLKVRVTDNEFRSFVDRCLKANKSPGPDGYTNESVKTMSYAELEMLREQANGIPAMEKARVMTVEEMNWHYPSAPPRWSD